MSAVVQPNFDPAQIVVDALRMELLIRTLIGEIRTVIPVEIVAVYPGTGDPPAIGKVDVQPLVQTVDGSGRLWNLGVTYGASFSRPQSGSTAFILDPMVGDIGLASACDRDISSVIAAQGLAGPGSYRTHDISDLVYHFSIISMAAITQYLQLTATLMKAVFPNIDLNGVTISSDGTLNAPILQSGNGATGSGDTVTVVNGIVTVVS